MGSGGGWACWDMVGLGDRVGFVFLCFVRVSGDGDVRCAIGSASGYMESFCPLLSSFLAPVYGKGKRVAGVWVAVVLPGSTDVLCLILSRLVSSNLDLNSGSGSGSIPSSGDESNPIRLCDIIWHGRVWYHRTGVLIALHCNCWMSLWSWGCDFTAVNLDLDLFSHVSSGRYGLPVWYHPP